MNKKILIFDSSSLISMSMAGLFEELKSLKKIFKGKFIITKEVKSEVIDKPLTIKKFELEALKLQDLLDSKIIEIPSNININEDVLSKKTEEVMRIANSTFNSNQREIKIIDSGEASCLALSMILNEKKIKNVIVIDERTLRMLCEKPEKVKEIMERKLHTEINYKKENLKFFNGHKCIRSTELIYVAYKKGFVKIKNKAILDALLYALKCNGCAISGNEIEEIKRIN